MTGTLGLSVAHVLPQCQALAIALQGRFQLAGVLVNLRQIIEGASFAQPVARLPIQRQRLLVTCSCVVPQTL